MTETKFAIFCLIGFLICISIVIRGLMAKRGKCKARAKIIKTGHLIIEIRPMSDDLSFDAEVEDMFQAIGTIIEQKEQSLSPPC
ncbi:MAG: hypothetical protein K6G36_02495 [Candidatus Saccharibacteria bacterium]|nr:hypothetical protein [Candidatus Saccharibacteria bacterium]